MSHEYFIESLVIHESTQRATLIRIEIISRSWQRFDHAAETNGITARIRRNHHP
jgi:hypothetical protein